MVAIPWDRPSHVCVVCWRLFQGRQRARRPADGDLQGAAAEGLSVRQRAQVSRCVQTRHEPLDPPANDPVRTRMSAHVSFCVRRREKGRPSVHLHADGGGAGRGHVGLCANRSGSLHRGESLIGRQIQPKASWDRRERWLRLH